MNTTDAPLRLLLVEDQRQDADLVCAALSSAGYSFTFTRVETEPDYSAALDASPDVVLCDHVLPTFSSGRALEILQARGLDTPLIIVSGQMGEEHAVEAMRRGADDYLLKDRLARLGPAVAAALERRRVRRQADRAADRLRKVQERLQLFLDHSPAVMFLKDKAGRYVRVNQEFLRAFGVRAEDVINKRDDAIFPPELAAQRTAHDRAVLQTGRPVHFEETASNAGGLRTFAVVMFPMGEAGDADYGIGGIATDVTQHKEGEARYRATFDSAPVGIMHSAVDSEKLLQVNPKLCEMLGYGEAELLELSVTDIIHPVDRHDDHRNRRLQMLDGEIETYTSEGKVLRKDGSSLWINGTISLVRSASGEPQYFLRMVEDISVRKQVVETLASERALLRAVVNAVPERIYVKDREGRFLIQNSANLKAHGAASPEALLGKTVFDIFPLETAKRIEEEDRSIMASGIPVLDLERAIPDAAGHLRWIANSKVPLPDAAGNIVGIVGMNRDITERKRMEQELMLSEETLRATFRQASVGITLTSLDLEFLEVNDQYCEIVGYTREELLGEMKVTAMSLPDAPDDTLIARRRLIAGEIQSYSREKRIKRKDGSRTWVTSAISLVHDAAGEPKHFVAVVQDISANKLAAERLVHLAHYDQLTRLPNRVLFYDRLKQALAQARRNGWVSAVIFIDLDRFKTVNDTLGHANGDKLLQDVSERLALCVRSGDTVGRLGGDEFAVVLNELAAPQDAGVVAQHILRSLAAPFEIEGNEIYATASAGIAVYPADGDDIDTLIRDADAAMYCAKAAGRNVYRYYTAEMNERALEKMKLETKLRHGLERDEFLLYYQPKIDLATGDIAGVEALLRWQPADGPLVSPDRFIPLLEETGLIVPVGDWVLRRACAQIKSWKEAGVRPVSIAVNLSARQFQQQDLCALVGRHLREHGVAPRLLELEITESVAMQNPEASIAMLRELKALGVRLAIDDFGTGYSSLSYLKRLPLDTVKIDRSFVTDLATSPDDASIAQAIIKMAHTLSLKVVAEGVETASQLSFLASHGCDQMQGYYFSRPLPEAEITEMLRQNRQLQRPEIQGHDGERTLLLLDDEENVLSSLKRLLRRDDYKIFTATNAQAAFEILANHRVGVIVSDQRMPGVTGVEFLRRVKELYPGSIRMVLSGYADVESVTDAINQGAIYRFLTKPWDDSLLRANIAEAFRRYAAVRVIELDQEQANARMEELSRTNRMLQVLIEERAGGIPAAAPGEDARALERLTR